MNLRNHSERFVTFKSRSIALLNLHQRAANGKTCSRAINLTTEISGTLLAICFSLTCGCAAEDNNNPEGGATDSKTYLSFYADRDYFEPRVLQFVDADTAKSIPKVRVSVLCMGQTPYSDSKDITDDNGNATFFSWKGGGIAIHADHPEYESKTILAPQGTQIVKLRKPTFSTKKKTQEQTPTPKHNLNDLID